MRLRIDCVNLPWLTAAVGIIGAGRVFLPAHASWAMADAWPTYIFFAVICGALVGLAYFGWRCHVERQLPAVPVRKLLAALAKRSSFSGTPAEYNKHAETILYGEELSRLLPVHTDYYSALIAAGLIQIAGVTDRGNRPDGTADTTMHIVLTDKAFKVLELLPEAETESHAI